MAETVKSFAWRHFQRLDYMQLGSRIVPAGARVPFYRAQQVGREGEFVAQALATGRVGSAGAMVAQCESLLAEMMGGAAVIATKSCTAGLELMAQLLELEPGDEVVVPSYAYVTTASAFAIRGAKVVFADVRPDDLNLDPESVRAVMTGRTRAVVALHYGGVACAMDELQQVVQRPGGPMLVEDNAHGTGGKEGNGSGRPLGAIGAMGALSFHETKNITCGEGGALIIGDPSLRDRAVILADKGTDRAQFLEGRVPSYTWVDVGSSYRMSELHGAFLLGQLLARKTIAEQRRHQWHRYADELAEWAAAQGVRLPAAHSATHPGTECGSTHHIFHMCLADRPARDRMLAALTAEGIQATFHYPPLHLSKVGRTLGGKPGDCPVAESAGECLLRLPLFHGLTADEQSRVIDAVRRFKG